MSDAHEVTPIWLWKRSTQEYVAAELWDAITDVQLNDWESLWKPGLQELRQKMRDLGVDPDSKIQTSYWNWDEKVEAAKGMLSDASFSVVAEGVTQGMMIVDNIHSCELLEQKGKPLVFVRYLEVAPWNQRPLIEIEPYLSGVGSHLFRTAIEASRLNEFSGRVGLRSLPQAERWYRNKCRMTDLGPLRERGLCYFEMTPEQADAFTA